MLAQVDKAICALGAGFLGNFPSTVTVSILLERDRRGLSRSNFDFFGSTHAHRAVIRGEIEFTAFKEPPVSTRVAIIELNTQSLNCYMGHLRLA